MSFGEWVLFAAGACFGGAVTIVAGWHWLRFQGLLRTKEEWINAHDLTIPRIPKRKTK